MQDPGQLGPNFAQLLSRVGRKEKVEIENGNIGLVSVGLWMLRYTFRVIRHFMWELKQRCRI